MREIKFRAWDKETKQLLIVNSLTLDFGFCDLWNGKPEDEGVARKLLDVNLMQYTGLKDKKGVEIYIGDIIIDNNMFIETVDVGIGQMPVAELPDGRIWEVTMRDFEEGIVLLNNEKETGCCDHVEGEFSIIECEVIGNIYQNPELLK